MLDVAKRRNGSKEVGLIEANLAYAPELAHFPARTISGTSYHTLLRTGLPTVAFTAVNEGVPSSKSSYENKLVECFPIRALIEIDKALVSADNPLSTLQTDESMGVTEAAMRAVGRQIYYGRAAGKGDPKGFHGLQDVVANEMLVDATGTTANGASSVYFIKFGLKDVQLVFGNNTVLHLPPFRDETLTDKNGGKYDGVVSHLTGWAGIQTVNPHSIARICNLTEQSGKGLTDALLAKALNKFPAGYRPDIILMSRRSREQLQADRSSRISLQLLGGKSSGGAGVYADFPESFQNIPVVETDSILNNEPIVA